MIKIETILNANLSETPYRYSLIDDVLDADDYAEFRGWSDGVLNQNPSLQRKYCDYQNTFGSFYNHDWDQVGLSTQKGNEYCQILDDHKEEILVKYGRYRNGENLFVKSELSFTPTGRGMVIHDENVSKIWSMVLYIYPKLSVGTVLYDHNQRYHTTVEWNPNRAIAFSCQDNITWHSYSNMSMDVRVTLNFYIFSEDRLDDITKKAFHGAKRPVAVAKVSDQTASRG